MPSDQAEIERRTKAALTEIRRLLGRREAAYSVNLFVQHHLAHLPKTYWQERCGTSEPSFTQVLDLLVLRSHWGLEFDDGDSDIDVFDFTLPGRVTQYVLTVHFDEEGSIESVAMES